MNRDVDIIYNGDAISAIGWVDKKDKLRTLVRCFSSVEDRPRRRHSPTIEEEDIPSHDYAKSERVTMEFVG